MTVLAAHLVQHICSQKDGAFSVFRPDTVLVQSPGMAQWLKLFIAEHVGIAANLAFPLPSSYIWQLYRDHISDLPEQSAYTKPNLTWKLMAILPKYIHLPEFASVKSYLVPSATLEQREKQNGNQDELNLRWFQLCHKIADVFDQYLVYRPEWIMAWEEHDDLLDEVDVSLHPWQPILWRALQEYTRVLGESGYHRANLHTTLIEQLHTTSDVQASEGENHPNSQPQPPLYVFGISALPQQQLELLTVLGQTRDVYIFWLNPSCHYWGDIVDTKTLAKMALKDRHNGDKYRDVGNPLLASWGKLGRDYQDMLLQLDVLQHDAFVDFPESHNLTLLQHIQREIYELTHRGSPSPLAADELLSNGRTFPKLPISATDNSLQIAVCHSKVRELEVLKDKLLHAFETDPSLQPGDVIVMMPDVAAYAPFIDGIFTDKSDVTIPYGISDRSAADASPLVKSFLQVMALHTSRFSLSDVLSLLDVPAVRRKFTISDNEFEKIKLWLNEAGVRWGWNATDKIRWGLPPSHQNTWAFGLERLLSGFAQTDHHVLFASGRNMLPYGEVEGQDSMAVGKLYCFCENLQTALNYCQTDAPLADKVAGAHALLDSLYDVDEIEQLEINHLRQVTESLLAHSAQYRGDISQDIFLYEVTQRLQEKGVGQRFLAGSVNFCTLMPMRSIPFKRVCILGLNDEDYPRQNAPLGFDLMRHAVSRRGDRSRKHDDRYLLLEALLSAEEQLYLSYQGFSERDNSEKVPSILLSELIEYCQQTFCIEGSTDVEAEKTTRMLTEHLMSYFPLQPFSPSNYLSNSGNGVSYQARWFDVAASSFVAEKPFHQPLTAETPDIDELQIEDLIRFFTNPARYFFRQRWGTSLSIYTQTLEDEEPFSLEPLTRFQLSEALITANEPDQFDSIVASGVLPAGQASQIHFDGLQRRLAPIKEALLDFRNNQPLRAHVDFPALLEGISVSGTIDHIYDGKLIRWRTGKVRGKDKLALYIEWLTLCALEDSPTVLKEAIFIGEKAHFTLPLFEQPDALARLSNLCSLWQQGLHQPLFFFPESAFAWLKHKDESKAIAAFKGNDFAKGDVSDPHIARLCPDLTQHFDTFTRVSESVLAGLEEWI